MHHYNTTCAWLASLPLPHWLCHCHSIGLHSSPVVGRCLVVAVPTHSMKGALRAYVVRAKCEHNVSAARIAASVNAKVTTICSASSRLNSKAIEWLDVITADCPKRADSNDHWRCALSEFGALVRCYPNTNRRFCDPRHTRFVTLITTRLVKLEYWFNYTMM